MFHRISFEPRLTSEQSISPRSGRRSYSRPESKLRPEFEPLDSRILLSGGWAAALGTAGTTSAHGVALDPTSASVYVAGSQLAKYGTDGHMVWSRGLAGPNSGWGVAVDSSGDAYVTGTFTGSLTLGNQTLTSAGGNDGFVAKFDPSGNVLWAKSFGGAGNDTANGIALDSLGSAYVTGRFSGTVAFDGTHSLTSAGDSDVLVLKLDAAGNVVYATQAGGSGRDVGIGITVDSSGQAYVTGYFAGSASFGSSILTSAGTYAGYVGQLDANGNFTWARPMGGPAATDPTFAQAQGVGLDSSGHVFATGTFIGTTAFGDSSDGTGAANLTALGTCDAFITSLDAGTGHFLWTKQLGGSSASTHGYGLALDGAGNIYTAGAFGGSTGTGINCDPGSGNAILTIQSSNFLVDGFVSRLSPTGGLLGAWQIGATPGNSSASATGVTVGSDGSVYTAGTFTDAARFDTGTQYVSLTSSSVDGFVSRMTAGQCVILGQVFSDLNHNGAKDAGEPPLSGVTVYIDANNNGKLDRNELSTTTNPQGGFSFYHLAPGTYTIREILPSGYTLTTPAAVSVPLSAGTFNDSTIFGDYRSAASPALAISSGYRNAPGASSGQTPIVVTALTGAEQDLIALASDVARWRARRRT